MLERVIVFIVCNFHEGVSCSGSGKQLIHDLNVAFLSHELGNGEARVVPISQLRYASQNVNWQPL
jgi:hypothetical protein